MATEESKSSVWLSIDLGTNGALLSFATPDEAKAWLETERKYWGWLHKTHQSESSIRPATQHLFTFFDALQGDLEHARGNPGNEAYKTKAEKRIVAAYRDAAPAINSKSAEAKFLEPLAQQNAKTAAFAYCSFVGRPTLIQGDMESTKGTFEAMFFRYNMTETARSERLLMKDVHAEATSQMARLKSDEAALRQEIEKQTKQGRDAHQSQKTEHAELVKAHGVSLDKALDESRADLEKLIKTYDSHMALKKPVEYWSKRSFWNYIFAAILGLATIALGVATLLFEKAPLEKLFVADKFQLSALGPALLLTTLLIWLLRILVRLLLTFIHSAVDARERALLIETYLALLRESKVFTGEEKEFFLKAIFRHTPTGLIKDDALPPYLEIFSRQPLGKPK